MARKTFDEIETNAWLAAKEKADDRRAKAMVKIVAARAKIDAEEMAIIERHREDLQNADRIGKRARWDAEWRAS